MKLKVVVRVTDAADCFTYYQNTGIACSAKVLNHIVEIEIPDPPGGFAVERIDLCGPDA